MALLISFWLLRSLAGFTLKPTVQLFTGHNTFGTHYVEIQVERYLFVQDSLESLRVHPVEHFVSLAPII